MPIVSSVLNPGDPTIQASGQYRGTIVFTFADGRTVQRNLRAPDEDAWSALLLAIDDEVEAKMQERDAEDAVSPDEDVAANLEASIAQTCIAYIRQAWNEELAFVAWALYDRINTYVTTHSDWNTAHTHLLAAGLTQDEYDQSKAAYQYLSGSGRPAIMASAVTIQNAWVGQH